MGQSLNKTERAEESADFESIFLAAKVIAEKKGRQLAALDLRNVASFTDCFLLCTGGNARQVQAIADAVTETLKKHGRYALHTEGHSAAEWILLDYGDFIVHVFSPTARQFYDLERLWRDAGRIDLSAAGIGPD